MPHATLLVSPLMLPLAACAAALAAPTAPAGDAPVELGAVAWGRDVDLAFERARAAGRPLLLLFQEVPG